jgi:hypothetical protein
MESILGRSRAGGYRMTARFDAEPVLVRLKDFQRRTVDYAFQRLFLDAEPSRRFLVADEVGLGKTLVAQGVIARTVEHLQDDDRRIDIIYICSNSDIAAQNVDRLNVTGQRAFVKATRLTLLPLEVHNLKAQKINFISFTPGTTFDHGKRTGQKQERILIYQMLESHLGISAKGLSRVLQANAGGSWFQQITYRLPYDESIARDFRASLKQTDLLERLRTLSESIADFRRTFTEEMKQQALALIGDLRRGLARCCLESLEPDLVILDEFQRFRDLLAAPDSSPSAELAHALFNYSDQLRVLLLSATPYKMYAAQHEDENHYSDFIATARFLFGDSTSVDSLEVDLGEFRTSLLTIDGAAPSFDVPDASKTRIENRLKRVMCRTERVGSTLELDAMVRECRIEVPVDAEDIREFRCIDRLSTAVELPDPIEYWRSSPYLLNFMKNYELKRRLADRKNANAVVDILRKHPYRVLDRGAIDAYRLLDPANGRLRTLVAEIDDRASWRLLWVPPSLPYWPGEGAYERADGFTKTLVFSSWNVVPDAIAGLLSYHVEARSLSERTRDHRYENLSKQLRSRLHYSAKGDGTFPGMNALALAYPSQTLTDVVDPLSLFVEGSGQIRLPEIRQRVMDRISALLPAMSHESVSESALPDRRWYWFSLILLDRHHHPVMREWCQKWWASARRGDEGEAAGGFSRHVEHWLAVWDGADPGLGRVPEDLLEVLANIALGGPAVCAFRALRRFVDAPDACLIGAVHISEGLRSQFNAPEAIAIVEQTDDEDAYWKRVLHYSCEGNIQAMLDEYIHLQFEAESNASASGVGVVEKVAANLFAAMSIRASQLRPDYPIVCSDRVEFDPDPLSIRCRYAVRYGQAEDEEGAIARKEVVRAAFNSPFRPFVLASTSVGQEGLDFHSWCHSIVHWNLPGNPVDLEQREGRVHRYKGHAVRRNVAKTAQKLVSEDGDPWEAMFDAVRTSRVEGSDLVPYWIYEIPGGAKVERRVFTMPFSKDESRLRRLKSSLALYRMVFGQPRQDDLLDHLQRQFDDQVAIELVARWQVDLRPTDLPSESK